MRPFVKSVISIAQLPFLDALVIKLFRLHHLGVIRVSGLLRSVLLEALSNDPMRRQSNLPEIDLVIPFAEKDQELVRLAVLGALSSSRNPIVNVVLVSPNGEASIAADLLLSLKADVRDYKATLVVLSDAEVLSEGLAKVLSQSDLKARNEGWLRQQLIKFLCVLSSPRKACLIVDADTVLLSPKTWLSSDGVQVLAPAEWFRGFWTDDVEKFLGVPKHLPFSYITHHQLMQKDIVQALLGVHGERLADWLETANTVVSEYDSYGSFLETSFPDRVRHCRFGNVESGDREAVMGLTSKSDWLSQLVQRNANANSLSLHHYLHAR